MRRSRSIAFEEVGKLTKVALAATAVLALGYGCGAAADMSGTSLPDSKLGECSTHGDTLVFDESTRQFAYLSSCWRSQTKGSLAQTILTTAPYPGAPATHIVLDQEMVTLVGLSGPARAYWASTAVEAEHRFTNRLRVHEVWEGGDRLVAETQLPFDAMSVKSYDIGDYGWIVSARIARAGRQDQQVIFTLSRDGRLQQLVVGALEPLYFDRGRKALIALQTTPQSSPNAATLVIVPIDGAPTTEIHVDTSEAPLPRLGRYIWITDSEEFAALDDGFDADGLRSNFFYSYRLEMAGNAHRLHRQQFYKSRELYRHSDASADTFALATNHGVVVVSRSQGRTLGQFPRRGVGDEQVAFTSTSGRELAVLSSDGIRIHTLGDQ